MKFGFWEIFMTAIYAINLGITLGKHGEQKITTYNFWTSLIGTLIGLACLYFGGFYN